MINSYWFFKLHFIQIQHHISSSNSIFAYSRLHFKFRNWICFFFSVHFRMMLNPPIQKASGIYIRHWICDCVIMYEMCQSICSYSVWWWFLKQQYVNHVFTSVDERPLLSLTSIQSLSLPSCRPELHYKHQHLPTFRHKIHGDAENVWWF